MKTSIGARGLVLYGIGLLLSLLSAVDVFRVISNNSRSALYAWIKADHTMLVGIDIILIVIGVAMIVYGSRLRRVRKS